MPLNSKRQKTLDRIWDANPNVTYSDVEELITALGGTIKSGGKGSHFRAKLGSERATIAKPHGGAKTLDIGAIKGIRNFMKRAGVIRDGNQPN